MSEKEGKLKKSRRALKKVKRSLQARPGGAREALTRQIKRLAEEVREAERARNEERPFGLPSTRTGAGVNQVAGTGDMVANAISDPVSLDGALTALFGLGAAAPVAQRGGRALVSGKPLEPIGYQGRANEFLARRLERRMPNTRAALRAEQQRIAAERAAQFQRELRPKAAPRLEGRRLPWRTVEEGRGSFARSGDVRTTVRPPRRAQDTGTLVAGDHPLPVPRRGNPSGEVTQYLDNEANIIRSRLSDTVGRLNAQGRPIEAVNLAETAAQRLPRTVGSGAVKRAGKPTRAANAKREAEIALKEAQRGSARELVRRAGATAPMPLSVAGHAGVAGGMLAASRKKEHMGEGGGEESILVELVDEPPMVEAREPPDQLFAAERGRPGAEQEPDTNESAEAYLSRIGAQWALNKDLLGEFKLDPNQRSHVQAMQKALNGTGLVSIRVDGIWGPETDSAIDRIQQEFEGEQPRDINSAYTQAIGIYDRPASVYELQNLLGRNEKYRSILERRGFAYNDNRYGPDTQAAATAFVTDRGRGDLTEKLSRSHPKFQDAIDEIVFSLILGNPQWEGQKARRAD